MKDLTGFKNLLGLGEAAGPNLKIWALRGGNLETTVIIDGLSKMETGIWRFPPGCARFGDLAQQNAADTAVRRLPS